MKLTFVVPTLLFITTSVQANSSSRLLKNEPKTGTQLLSHCLDLNLGESKFDCVECKVSGIDDFKKIGNEEFAVAHYDYFWAKDSGLGHCAYGDVLLQKVSATSYIPLWGGVSETKVPEKVKVIHNSIGTFIQIPIRFSGTGAGEQDGLLVRENGKWNEVDTKSYQEDLADRLPHFFGIWKGIYPDYKSMTLESNVWIEGDANCCGTGGKVKANLGLEADKIVIREFHHQMDPSVKNPETLTSEKTIEGLTYPEESWVIYDPKGAPRLVELGDEANLMGYALPKGTDLSLRAGQATAHQILDSFKVPVAWEWHGISFPSKTRFNLNELGKLIMATIPGGQLKVGKISCKDSAVFYPSGELRECDANEDQVIDGKTFKRNSKLSFDEKGRLKTSGP